MKNQIKYLQNLFHDLLNDYGRAFVVVKYSDQTIIGARGFTEEEKEKGLVLVFNTGNHKNLQWTEDGSIVAALGFGSNNRIENCFIHHEDIVAVFCPDAKVKFDRWDVWDALQYKFNTLYIGVTPHAAEHAADADDSGQTCPLCDPNNFETCPNVSCKFYTGEK